MSFQQFANSVNPATTLSGNGGSIISGATTLIVASVANLPSNPNFTIGVSTSGTIEWMLVTGISGTTLTVTRHQEGSSAASHTDGDNVYLVLTGGALTQILQDTSNIGAFASRPTSTTGARQGIQYRCTDYAVVRMFDGSAFKDFYSPIALTAVDVPLSIPGLYVWCAADKLSGYSDGDSVFSWPNLAPDRPAITCGSTAPIYKTSILNSLPVVRSAGAAYLGGVLPEVICARETSLFLVIKFSSLANGYTGIVASAGGSFGWYVKSNGKTAFYTAGTNYDGSGAATMLNSSFYVITMINGPQGVATRVALAADLTSASTGFQTTATTPQCYIGNDQSAGRVLTGDIAEIVMYRRAVSSTERDSVESYLKTKYGL